MFGKVKVYSISKNVGNSFTGDPVEAEAMAFYDQENDTYIVKVSVQGCEIDTVSSFSGNLDDEAVCSLLNCILDLNSGHAVAIANWM